jgi:AraC-like DNA-binding protein
MSFSKWRQHACVLLSLERLIRQHSIQQIAYDFGFKNPAAFSTMFHRVLGMSPSRYIQRNDFAN